jgi:MinD superfamily P-loop ATPase
MVDMPQIDQNKCDGCGLCVDVCRCHIISIVENKATICYQDVCSGCRNWCTLCEDICPNKAIVCAFDVVIENRAENT